MLLTIAANSPVIGCGKPSTAPPLPENSGTASDSPRIAEDRSPASADYAAAGFPSIDAAWTPADYMAAADVLVAIAADDPRRLPRLGSERSAAAFARIVAAENLAPLDATETPLATRIEWSMAFMAPIEQITLVYIHAGGPRVGTFDAEVAALNALNVRMAATMAELATAYLSQLAPTDADFPSRATGYARLIRALEPNVAAAVAALSDAAKFRDSIRESLAIALAGTLPRVLPHLPKSTQHETRRRVADLARARLPDALHTAIANLATAIEPATTSTPRPPSHFPPPHVTVHRENAGTAGADGWTEIASTAGKFSVRVPAAGDDYTTTARTTSGDELTMHTITAHAADGRIFSATRYLGAARDADGKPLPERVADSFAMSDSFAGESKFTAPGGGEGIEITTHDGQTIARVRVFIVGDDAFQLVAEFAASADASADAAAQRFFESFRLLP